uniref:hypothetical protein n=1 Tax=Falsiroseomonas oryzae TaxID=2766473 RepID=UPI0022EAEB0A
TAAAPLALRALVAGEEVGRWSFAEDQPVTLAVPLPAALRGRADPVMLELLPDPPRAPRPLGLGASEGRFGFGLIAIEARPAGQPTRHPRLALDPGATLRFAAGALPAGALGPDWHVAEPDATWSFGRAALLPLRLGPAVREQGTVLTASLEGFRATRITASAAGRRLADAPLHPGARNDLEIPVPPGLAGESGELDLVLEVDAARSPFAAGDGGDERPLGLRLASLHAAPAEQRAQRAEYLFSAAGSAAALRLEGWFDPEPDGRWSEAAGARIRLPRPEGAGDTLRLEFDGRVYGTRHGGPARVDVEVDGVLAAFLVFEDDAFATRVAQAVVEPGHEAVTLSVRRPGGVSPAECGEGDDARRLGLMLRRLVVVWE